MEDDWDEIKDMFEKALVDAIESLEYPAEDVQRMVAGVFYCTLKCLCLEKPIAALVLTPFYLN